ncbi:N-myristoyltransferase [Aureococcus anophagefferens]|uniref:Thiamine pyrimidine synthase n=1 Tax=Aureococcus anophagefferens TaxID=44056 RepID=A0ABR1G2Y9_AURAN
MLTMRIGLVLVTAAARAATVEVDASGEATATKLRIGLEWFLNPDHMPFVVADKLGFFREQNLEVELVAPADHWEAEKEILAGRLDVAVTETLHLAQDAAAGKPILGFARFLHTDGGVMYFADSGIERPRDMCGKTITYPGPRARRPAIVDTMVKADGGDCGGEPTASSTAASTTSARSRPATRTSRRSSSPTSRSRRPRPREGPQDWAPTN